MRVRELLDEVRENILHDRSDRVAGTPDYLWSDATLVRYIDEAQKRFARRGLVIRDGRSPEATKVTLREGVDEYTLHPAVLAVISARVEPSRRDLVRAGHHAFNVMAGGGSERVVDPAAYAELPPGNTCAYSTDEQTGTENDADRQGAVVLRVYPTPAADNAGDIIRLRVVRGPIYPLTMDTLEAQPEIPEAHHLDMLDWVGYLALRIADTDAGNLTRAKEYRVSFEAHVREARQESLRKLYAPLGWGFGRNGFSWER